MPDFNSPEEIDTISPFEARRRLRVGGPTFNVTTHDLLMKRAVPPNPPDHNSPEDIETLSPLQAEHRLARESGPNLHPDAAKLLEKRAEGVAHHEDYPENSPEEILTLTPLEARERMRADVDHELHPEIHAALRRRAGDRDHYSTDQYRPEMLTGPQAAEGDDLVPCMFYRPLVLTIEGFRRVFFGVGTQLVPKRFVEPQLDALLATHGVLQPDDLKPRKRAKADDEPDIEEPESFAELHAAWVERRDAAASTGTAFDEPEPV